MYNYVPVKLSGFDFNTKKIKNFIMKFGSSFAALALIIGITTSNSACGMIFHQPEEPAAMNKFKF